MLQLHRIQDQGRDALRIEGEFTIYAVADARRDLESWAAQRGTLILDLSGVEETDTAGVQLLLWLKREVARRGDALAFVRHSPAVVEAFDLLHVTGLFGDPILLSPA